MEFYCIGHLQTTDYSSLHTIFIAFFLVFAGTTSSVVDHLVMVATTIVAAKSTNKTGPCKAVGHASFSRREDTVEKATPADSLTYGETDSTAKEHHCHILHVILYLPNCVFYLFVLHFPCL